MDAIRTGVVARGRIDGRRLVGLVTVSEMESWAIASPDAIAQSLGFDGWPNRLPLAWNSIDVETLDDPKRELKSALQKLLQRNLDPALFYDTLEALGSRVPLDALAVLPSYCKFRERLRECLKALRAAR